MARSSRPLANRRVVVEYTQEALAEALGVDRTTIGRWELGEQQPQPWQRPDLALKPGVTLEELDRLLRHPGPESPTCPPLLNVDQGRVSVSPAATFG